MTDLDLAAIDALCEAARDGISHESGCAGYRTHDEGDCDCAARRAHYALGALVARVREIEADAARFGWLEDFAIKVSLNNTPRPIRTIEYISTRAESGWGDVSANTLRAAIDAAISAGA